MAVAAAQRSDVLHRTAAPLAVAAGLTTAALAVAVRDPHAAGSWGRCPFLVLTGLPCPFCGGLRAVWDLEHAQVGAALGSNLLVVLTVPLTLLALGWWGWRRLRGTRTPLPAGLARWGLPLGLVLVLGFGVARWVPALSALAP